jgi:anti-sigma regulatory factor (Ser/Thr protein kinase)
MDDQHPQPEPRRAFYRRERRSVPLARDFARQAVLDWRLIGRLDDVLLCVSELATNALVHGVPPGRGFALHLRLGEDGVLRVEVHDSGSGEPFVKAPNVDKPEDQDEWGRGLLLVSAVADAWGVAERVPGKIVWCEFSGGGRC